MEVELGEIHEHYKKACENLTKRDAKSVRLKLMNLKIESNFWRHKSKKSCSSFKFRDHNSLYKRNNKFKRSSCRTLGLTQAAY